MTNKDKVIQVVFAAIDEVNTMLPREERLNKSFDVSLSGNASVLDSLQLTNLIVAVEQEIDTQLNETVILTDERAMNQDPNPFITIGTLIDYIESKLYK